MNVRVRSGSTTIYPTNKRGSVHVHAVIHHCIISLLLLSMMRQQRRLSALRHTNPAWHSLMAVWSLSESHCPSLPVFLPPLLPPPTSMPPAPGYLLGSDAYVACESAFVTADQPPHRQGQHTSSLHMGHVHGQHVYWKWAWRTQTAAEHMTKEKFDRTLSCLCAQQDVKQKHANNKYTHGDLN